MPGHSGEWGGDIWGTFKVVEKTDIWLRGRHSYQGPEQVKASPTEYRAPQLFRLPTGLAVVLPKSLDRRKVVHAAQKLLAHYPIIGARLLLKPGDHPCYQLVQPSFGLSFATWAGSTADDFYRASQWSGSAAGICLPSSPLFMDVQADRAYQGLEPMFNLRVTELGDGTCVLAASFLHSLLDGTRIIKILKDMAAAYTGQRALPTASPERIGTPAQLIKAAEAAGQQVPEVLLDPRLAQPIAKEQGERFHTLFASDEGYFANMKLIRDREVPAQLPELDRIVNLCLAEEDLCALRAVIRQHPAVAALPQSYISSNDVVVAVSWLLSCDMHQHPKPGHAPAGGMNFALLVLDLLGNDRDGLLTSSLVPPGAIQMFNTLLPIVIPAPEQPALAEPESLSSLQHSIGLAAAACRSAVLLIRSPGQILAEWSKQSKAAYTDAAAPPPTPDLFCTNWDQLGGYKDINFGAGPPQGLTGTVDVQQTRMIAVFPVPGAKLGLRMAVTPGMLARLEASKVLDLLPHSGLMAF